MQMSSSKYSGRGYFFMVRDASLLFVQVNINRDGPLGSSARARCAPRRAPILWYRSVIAGLAGAPRSRSVSFGSLRAPTLLRLREPRESERDLAPLHWPGPDTNWLDSLPRTVVGAPAVGRCLDLSRLLIRVFLEISLLSPEIFHKD